ncbi:Cytochrome c oxidase biogenesis protein Cmc1 like family protein [Babesia bovis T2Bo]|uniref:Cytochrome c oxidase biogenesis protein Cmc1 like family protein n=1 Tax=Babesia bovis T2Bo TaxID=484906 RepID=UPI001C3486C2|nr:Cytochrome c oxidase biogenesis protein Cmc1 like family protein [Babesia bovis T2Bo]KAG6440042.1 Cytochrome c oxidase biogenesis protein Cmc1 like family protein [Babesia bovis T2Bo]
MEQQPPLYVRIAQKLRKANDDTPMSYLEFREADYKLAKERQEVTRIIGQRVRDLCRSELDDYINCYTGNRFPMFRCREDAERMKKCIKHYEQQLNTPEYQQKIMEERLKSGDSFVVPSFLKRQVEHQDN